MKNINEIIDWLQFILIILMVLQIGIVSRRVTNLESNVPKTRDTEPPADTESQAEREGKAA